MPDISFRNISFLRKILQQRFRVSDQWSLTKHSRIRLLVNINTLVPDYSNPYCAYCRILGREQNQYNPHTGCRYQEMHSTGMGNKAELKPMVQSSISPLKRYAHMTTKKFRLDVDETRYCPWTIRGGQTLCRSS